MWVAGPGLWMRHSNAQVHNISAAAEFVTLHCVQHLAHSTSGCQRTKIHTDSCISDATLPRSLQQDRRTTEVRAVFALVMSVPSRRRKLLLGREGGATEPTAPKHAATASLRLDMNRTFRPPTPGDLQPSYEGMRGVVLAVPSDD